MSPILRFSDELTGSIQNFLMASDSSAADRNTSSMTVQVCFALCLQTAMQPQSRSGSSIQTEDWPPLSSDLPISKVPFFLHIPHFVWHDLPSSCFLELKVCFPPPPHNCQRLSSFISFPQKVSAQTALLLDTENPKRHLTLSSLCHPDLLQDSW